MRWHRPTREAVLWGALWALAYAVAFLIPWALDGFRWHFVTSVAPGVAIVILGPLSVDVYRKRRRQRRG